jgi:hypothetical protein
MLAKHCKAPIMTFLGGSKLSDSPVSMLSKDILQYIANMALPEELRNKKIEIP